MKKVTAYKINEYIRRETDGEYEGHMDDDQEIAVIEGTDNRVVVVGSEGVSHLLDSLDEKYMLELHKVKEEKVNEDGSVSLPVSIFAEATAKVPLRELIENVSTSEVDLGEFVRHFGSRLEQNYALLMGQLKTIGLDPKDYPREDRTRGSRTKGKKTVYA